jgi:hypothetical protein
MVMRPLTRMRLLAVLVFFGTVALLRWWDYEGPPW